jgi:hypothetical protein
MTPWTRDQPVVRPLPTHRTTQTQNKRTQTSMPRVGFEPTAPVFERAKTVHALDRAATVISTRSCYDTKFCSAGYGGYRKTGLISQACRILDKVLKTC